MDNSSDFTELKEVTWQTTTFQNSGNVKVEEGGYGTKTVAPPPTPPKTAPKAPSPKK